MYKLYKVGAEYPLIRLQKMATEDYEIAGKTVTSISLCIMHGESAEFAAEQAGVVLRKPPMEPLAASVVEPVVAPVGGELLTE